MARNILNQLLDKRITQLKAKAKTKTLTAATPTVDDPTLQTWIKEVSSTVKDIASSGVRRSDLVRAGIATITNGELQNALSPPEEVNLTVPAAVLNLTANGAYSSNTLTWKTRPSKFFGQNNIYRSDVDDFGTATHIGSSLGDVYTDYVGNNIKAYYWVRTISKFGVEGELSPSVYAATAIDVGYVLQQLEGHITLSQLDQILRGEISSISDIANGLQEEARLRVLELAALADQLRQESIDKAQEIQNKIDGVNSAIQQQIIGLNDGITTELNSRIDAEQQIINALEAYKLSNDSAVGAVIDKVDIAISTNEVHAAAISGLQTNFETVSGQLATKADVSNLTLAENKIAEVDGKVVAVTENITALGTRMDTVEGAVSTKLEASAINNYYTKTESDDKATTIAAGEISKYDANLVIGGDNLLTETKTFNKAGTLELSKTTLRPNYAGFGSAFITDPDSMLWRTHTVVQVRKDWCGFYYSCNSDNPNDWFASQDMTLSVWVKNSTNADINAYGIVPALGLVATIPIGEWQRIEMRIEKGHALRNSNNQGIIEFNFTSTEGAFYYAAPMLQYGNAVTSWQPSQEEVQNALDANASAIQATTADVSRIDGVITSQASSISLLQSSLSDVDTKANTAINNAATAQQTANTAVTAVEANAGIITKLESTLASGVGSRNYLLNSAEAGTAKVISEDFNFMELEIGDVIQMSFDIDITSPVSAGYRDRIGYELYSPLQDGGNAWVGVWLHGVSSLGVTKQRVNNSYTVVSKFTTNPKEFYYHVQTEGGAFTVKNVQLTVSKIPVKTWSAAPEDLATASALNNYYTKTQADDKALTIAAGEVSKYDANLVIGGTNLLLNSDFSGDASWSKWGDNGGGYVKVADPTYGTVLQTNLPSGIVHAWVKLENNVEYTYSALVKPSNNLWSNGNVPLHYWAGKDNVHQNKIHVLSYSPTLIEAGKWTRINIVFKLIDDADSFRPYIFGLNGVLQIAWTKLERGNKATDWSPNSVEMQHSINANASAVQSTKAEVLRIDGIVTSQASQIVTLESSKSAIENGGIAGNDEFIVDLRDPAYNRDLYYPVLLSAFSTEYRQTIRVMATLNGASVPPWSSHGGGFSLNAQFQMGGAGWGTINPEIVTDNFSYSWTHGSISPLDQIGQIWESSQPFFYVRGGGYYRLSKPVNRSVRVCAPNGSLSGYYVGTLYPRPYQASTVPESINQGLNQQNVKLQQTNAVLDGVKAVSTVTVDNNGVMSGYGLISELANGQVRSSFGVNADTFYIGSPSNNKKPFIHRNDWSVINGVWVPPGTYIDTALIANATISNAQVGDLSADKITAGNIAADRMKANIVSAMSGQFTELSAITAKIGVLRTATSGARTEIRDNLIEVYDSAGRIRIRMGVF